MLKLNEVTISVQSFGSCWAVFLQGKQEDIEARFNSFWNWKGISGNKCELDWWYDNCATFFTYPEKFTYAMQMAALQEILNTENTKGSNPLERARLIAKQRIDSIEMVNWIKYAASPEIFEMGSSVSAEKGTGNFDDDVLSKGAEITVATAD